MKLWSLSLNMTWDHYIRSILFGRSTILTPQVRIFVHFILEYSWNVQCTVRFANLINAKKTTRRLPLFSAISKPKCHFFRAKEFYLRQWVCQCPLWVNAWKSKNDSSLSIGCSSKIFIEGLQIFIHISWTCEYCHRKGYDWLYSEKPIKIAKTVRMMLHYSIAIQKSVCERLYSNRSPVSSSISVLPGILFNFFPTNQFATAPRMIPILEWKGTEPRREFPINKPTKAKIAVKKP